MIKCLQARELETNTNYYIELVAKGSGKSEEEIAKDIQRPKHFKAQQAIDYGLADKILSPTDELFEKKVSFCNYSCLCSKIYTA